VRDLLREPGGLIFTDDRHSDAEHVHGDRK
jgi:hypothetical protein